MSKESLQLLFSLFSQSSGVVAHNDLAAILHKDAVYNAVGLAAFDLYDEVIHWRLGNRTPDTQTFKMYKTGKYIFISFCSFKRFIFHF